MKRLHRIQGKERIPFLPFPLIKSLSILAIFVSCYSVQVARIWMIPAMNQSLLKLRRTLAIQAAE